MSKIQTKIQNIAENEEMSSFEKKASLEKKNKKREMRLNLMSRSSTQDDMSFRAPIATKNTTVVQLYKDTTVTFDFKIQHNSTTLVFTTFTTPQLCELLM